MVVSVTKISVNSPSPAGERRVFPFDVSRRLLVDYRLSMSPRVAVLVAESGVDTVRRWAPRAILGCSPRRGWCGG